MTDIELEVGDGLPPTPQHGNMTCDRITGATCITSLPRTSSLKQCCYWP